MNSRFLHYLRICFDRLRCPGCSTPESYHFICHEHTCFYCHQQDADSRTRRTCYSWPHNSGPRGRGKGTASQRSSRIFFGRSVWSKGRGTNPVSFLKRPSTSHSAYFYSTNVLTILSLVAAINAVLTWVGHGFGIHQLTLQLVLGYIGYPLAFFLGLDTFLRS